MVELVLQLLYLLYDSRTPEKKKYFGCFLTEKKYNQIFPIKIVKQENLGETASRQFSTPVFFSSYYNLKPSLGNLTVGLQEGHYRVKCLTLVRTGQLL